MLIGASTARSGKMSSGATEVVSTAMELRHAKQFQQVADSIGISGGHIWWPAGRPGPRFWHGGCFDSRVWGRCMSFRPFTSESYSENDRLEAWRDVLSALGLRPSAASNVPTGDATASRRSAESVVLAKLAGR